MFSATGKWAVALLCAAAVCMSSCGKRESKLESGRLEIHNQAKAREDSLVRELSRTDSLLVTTQVLADSLRGGLTVRSNPVESYLAPKGSTLPATGVEARLNMEAGGTEAVFYLVAQATGMSRFTSVAFALSEGGEWLSTESVAYDGERNSVRNGQQTVIFMGAQTDSVARAMASWPAGTGCYMRFSGGGRALKLAPQAVANIVSAYRYAQALRDMQVLARSHQRLERLLETARQQVARTMPEPPAEAKEQ